MTNRMPGQAPDPSAAKDFFHHLHNTLVLLGAGSRYATLVENPEAITASDVDDLRRYNLKLVDAVKDKLANIHKLGVVPTDG